MKKLFYFCLILFVFTNENANAQKFQWSRLNELHYRISSDRIFIERNWNPQRWDQSNYAHLYSCWEGIRLCKLSLEKLGMNETNANIFSIPVSFAGACAKEVYDQAIGVTWGNDDFAANNYGLLLGAVQNFTEQKNPKLNNLIDHFRRGTELSTWIYDYGWRYGSMPEQKVRNLCWTTSLVVNSCYWLLDRKNFTWKHFLAGMAGVAIGALINEKAPHYVPRQRL